MDLVRMREWCEEVAQSQGDGSALILPSSNHLIGPSASQRAVSGSTMGSQGSAASGVKEKVVKRLKDRGKDKEKMKLTSNNAGPGANSSSLLNVHSDVDIKSDTGRSTEGEDSESAYPSNANSRINTPAMQVETLSSNPAASASFGSLLGGRVRGKLIGGWAANLTKRKGQSVDLGASASPPVPPSLALSTNGNNSLQGSAIDSPIAVGNGTTSASGARPEVPPDDNRLRRSGTQHRHASAPPLAGGGTGTGKLPGVAAGGAAARPPMLSIKRENSGHTNSGPQSPTLPPMLYPGDATSGGHGTGVLSEEDDFEHDPDVLSSGQISPLSAYLHSPILKTRR